MSLLFADIYEAIQNLRIQKGVSEKDILNYVEERVGGCLKAANFMKTIRTLQKLVDEGVLIKKGKRFMFSSSSKTDDEEDDELDMDDDECDEAEERNEENDCDDDCDDDEEDDDDDDDDEDDDEDDDDDDDDDECDEKDVSVARSKQTSGTSDPQKSTVSEKYILSPNKTNNDNSGKNDNDYTNGVKRIKSTENDEGKNNGRLSGKEARSVIEQKGEKKSKEGETIAFCVRDFIDSLYRPTSECNNDDDKISNKPDDFPQENMDAIEKDDIITMNNRRRPRTKRGGLPRNSFRSRSPVKKEKNDTYYSLKKDRSDEFWSGSNQFLQEPMDADMEVDLEDKDPDVITEEYEECRHRTSVGPLASGTPGTPINRVDSCSSNHDSKKGDACFEGDSEFPVKKNVQAQLMQLGDDSSDRRNWFTSEEGIKRKEKIKRSASIEGERSANEEERSSLCSLCEKNKIND